MCCHNDCFLPTKIKIHRCRSKIFSSARLVELNILDVKNKIRKLVVKIRIMLGTLREVNIKFDKFPFSWGDDVVFLESGYDFHVNKFISSNLTAINNMLHKYENENRQDFIYLPSLCTEHSDTFRYYAPWGISGMPISSSLLLQFMHCKTKRGTVPPCFIRYHYTREGNPFLAYEFNLDEWSDGFSLVDEIFRRFSKYNTKKGQVYNSTIIEREPDFTADDYFDFEVLDIMNDVHEKINRLRMYGVSEWAIRQLVEPEIKWSKLVVTDDCRIILPGYNNMEIKMEPLVKAVYLLFLRHAEGIRFKCLPDYRTELYDIYLKVRACSTSPASISDEKIRKSICDVTNPLLNSINEKCARIREAFISRFDDSMAVYYYVTGRRGEPKRIALPRRMVELKW